MEIRQRSAVLVIEPDRGWTRANLRELIEYRDLLFTLVSRNIKVQYAQTILGFAWAILNPLMHILIFSVIFGKVAKVPTDGIPYVLFSTVAIIPWTYMSEVMTSSSQSLVGGQGMLGKIYFPRLIFPLTPVFSKLVDFGISLIILIGVMLYYRVTPTANLLILPLLLLMMMMVPAAIGLWLSSLAIRFRDVRFAMNYVLKLLIYSAPVLYSLTSVPEQYRLIYGLNPIVAVVEGFRACLLGTAIAWDVILPGCAVTVLMLIGGVLYFKNTERVFVDVI